MRLQNLIVAVDVPAGPHRLPTLLDTLERRLGTNAAWIRLSIVDVKGDHLTTELTVARFAPGERWAVALEESRLPAARRKTFSASPFGVAQIVPTGIRCDLGGYAGDATPATNLLAAAADFVVTHPNAVNASDINEMAANVLYVEGFAIDEFLCGRIALRQSHSNRVGTFFDPSGRDYVDEVVHVLNAAKAVAGIAADPLVFLDTPVGAQIEWAASGSASGTIESPDVVLDGVARLLDEGCDAVGGVSVIHGVTRDMCERHMRGEIPNPSGAIEAILTHLISKVFRVPCAHAPLPYYRDVKDRSTGNPRASAEFISTPHYFSVLKGLARAPRIVEIESLDHLPDGCLSVNHIGAIVMPATALGGLPALAAEFHRIPLVAVRQNSTILQMSAERLRLRDVIVVENYLEAAGVVLALRSGITLESLRRPIARAELLAALPLKNSLAR